MYEPTCKSMVVRTGTDHACRYVSSAINRTDLLWLGERGFQQAADVIEVIHFVAVLPFSPIVVLLFRAGQTSYRVFGRKVKWN